MINNHSHFVNSHFANVDELELTKWEIDNMSWPWLRGEINHMKIDIMQWQSVV